MSIAVYASTADLVNHVAPGQTSTALDDRMETALILASRYVDDRLGIRFGDEPTTPPYTIEVVACDPRWRAATIAAAARFYKSADIPFGVVGGWEYAVRAQGSIPEVDLILGTPTWNIG